MRILIVHTIYKYKGGEDSVVDNEKDLLRSAGHEVTVLDFSNAKGIMLKIAQLPFNLSSYYKTLNKIRSFKPDVIHVHNLHFAGSVSVLYATRRCKVPVVVTLHNYRLLCPSGTLFNNNQLFTSSVNRLIPFEAISKGVYKNSKILTAWLALSGMINQLSATWKIPEKFIVLGLNQKELFFNSRYTALTNRMEIKPNFCYPTVVKPQQLTNYYLFVGRLSAEKGIDVLIKAFSKTTLQLKIIGSGPLEDDVKTSADIHSNITYLGSADKTTIYRLLQEATALIFPSIWYETFGMVIIEAFACGTPVIASAIGEPMNMITDKINGLIFEPGNELDLVDKINYYQTLSEETKISYQKAALETYNTNYTPQINLVQLEKIYHSAIESY